jgi:molecular chaperone HscC
VPIDPNQPSIRIDVYQGESRMVRDNILLGEITLPLMPGPGHAEGVEVRFTYDVNGLLEVEVTVVATSETRRLVIEGNAGSLGADEVARRLDALAALKVHPRDTLENRTLLARAERLYEQLLGESRDHLGQMILRFEQVLATQDPRLVARDAALFREALQDIEANDHFAPDVMD